MKEQFYVPQRLSLYGPRSDSAIARHPASTCDPAARAGWFLDLFRQRLVVQIHSSAREKAPASCELTKAFDALRGEAAGLRD